jgi:phospholipid transport system transporter-binding protein
MLLLPTSVTAKEANDTRRLLTQALKGEQQQATVVIDASNLQQFDSAALAVLLECQRAAEAWGKPFALRNAPPKLTALARLYGVDVLLMPDEIRVDESGAAQASP